MAEIQSLARGLIILDQLAGSASGVSVTELADVLGVDKGSASRLVSTLASYGYAEKDAITRRFRLGPQVLALSRSLLSHLPLREAAKPFLHQLVAASRECAHVGILSQGRVLYIDQVESQAALRVNAEVGMMAPLHCTALGKVLLAFNHLPLDFSLDSFTENSITAPDALRKQLETIRRQGYALDDEEFDLGVRCIAAPIYDFREKVIGSIGISGPTARITPQNIDQYIKHVLTISEALSEKMRFARRNEDDREDV